MKKTITILTPTFNEADNIDELYSRISKITKKNSKYNFEHLFIDNASSDGSIDKIKQLAKKDKKVKAIFNIRNFGAPASMLHGLKQVQSDACIHIASDLQDPPEVIPDLIKKWEEDFKIVVLVKKETEEAGLMAFMRKRYYRFLTSISEMAPIEDSTGNGLIDQKIIKILNTINDPLFFFRGFLVEVGYPIGKVYFKQLQRTKGETSNSLYALYDLAMLGITNHSKVPIRLLSVLGFILSILSFVLTIIYFLLKIIFWQNFDIGMAPLLIGLFFFGSIQMFFLGLIGEYIGVIHSRVRDVPSIVESERINF
jgi:glycosyltransferase involved in cell wall biosynthesis